MHLPALIRVSRFPHSFFLFLRGLLCACESNLPSLALSRAAALAYIYRHWCREATACCLLPLFFFFLPHHAKSPLTDLFLSVSASISLASSLISSFFHLSFISLLFFRFSFAARLLTLSVRACFSATRSKTSLLVASLLPVRLIPRCVIGATRATLDELVVSIAFP